MDFKEGFGGFNSGAIICFITAINKYADFCSMDVRAIDVLKLADSDNVQSHIGQ